MFASSHIVCNNEVESNNDILKAFSSYVFRSCVIYEVDVRGHQDVLGKEDCKKIIIRRNV